MHGGCKIILHGRSIKNQHSHDFENNFVKVNKFICNNRLNCKFKPK